MKQFIAFAFFILFAACKPEIAMVKPKITPDKELIILAAPPEGDTYYAQVEQDIFEFHIAFANAISTHDNVLILAGPGRYQAYVAAFGADKVVLAEMADIWMRDFSLSNANAPIMFRYTAAGQGDGRTGQRDADIVQETLADFLTRSGIDFADTDWLNDGGNFVDDDAGNIVISRKFLHDNNLEEPEAQRVLGAMKGVENVAFIDADEQGGLEHADGVVAFIGPNVLAINSYEEDEAYAKKLQADLKAGLPNVTLHKIITPYDGSQIYDPRFGSACGLYTNMLVTQKRIYFPQFGIKEDAIALAQIRQWTDREIIPVQSAKICKMGGGVRCMSWQVRGELAAKIWSLMEREE